MSEENPTPQPDSQGAGHSGVPRFPNINMPRMERPKIGPFGWTLIALLVLAGLVIAFSHVWVRILWFNQIGYSQVFWTQWIAKAVLFVVGALIVGVVVGVNLFVAYRSRSNYVPLGDSAKTMAPYQRQIQPWRKLIFWVVSIVAGIGFGSVLSADWQQILLFFNRSDFGTVDPQFGLDVSFYIFVLPFLRLAVSILLTAFGVALGVVAIVAYIYGGLTFTPKFAMARPTRVHVAVLGAILMLLVAANLWLDRYSALIAEGSRFSGAGYTVVHASIPGSAILAGIAVVIALAFVYAAFRADWKVPLIGLVTMVVASLLIGTAYPYVVQRFQVDPNAVERESEYIQRNIDATLEAFGLGDVNSEAYEAETEASAGQLREDSESTAQIRLWDPTIADQTFRQYQQSRQYYDFATQLSVDRYNLDGVDHDTIIAVRELNLGGLDSAQRTWINDHTVYTHGYGVVAAYGNQTAADGRPVFFEQGVPSTGLLPEYEQRIYFGEGMGLPEFSIVGAPEGSTPWEFDYPSDQAENQYVSYTFTGDGGPNIGRLVNKVAYAIALQDLNILFSDRVTSESQILYIRDPRDRVAEVAPFLTLDGRSYPAVVDMDDNPDTPARVVWIVDGYTTSNDYPYSTHEALDVATQTSQQTSIITNTNQVNYMRNSIKAVVDAYDGSVTLYQWDEQDPIINAWSQIYPGLVTPVSEVSGDLMSHFRYPEDLFKVQRELMARYHVDEPASFYSGNDFWAVPNDPTAGEEVPQPPYYMTVTMPGQENAAFSLTTAFIPGGQSNRQILTGFMAVNADAGNEPGVIADGYGDITVLELPRDLTVPGPGQVQNMFNADFTVSQELNLLQQGGSSVLRGNLLTLPVGGGLLYVQPVYTQSSSGTQVPLLHRVLVSFGDTIGFAPTLQEALDQVFGGDSGAQTGETVAPEDMTGAAGATTATPEEQLRQALAAAAQAITDSNAALAAGDWAAYGQAQDALDQALTDAINAEAAASGMGPVTSTPDATGVVPGDATLPTDGAIPSDTATNTGEGSTP